MAVRRTAVFSHCAAAHFSAVVAVPATSHFESSRNVRRPVGELSLIELADRLPNRVVKLHGAPPSRRQVVGNRT